MNHRQWLIVVCCVLGTCLSGCAETPPLAPGPDTSELAPDIGTNGAGTDPDPPRDRCCPAGVCPLGEVCLEGACHAHPGSGGCLVDVACAQGQVCAEAQVCGCDAGDCDTRAGFCWWPEGCCNSDEECDAGSVCHEGVCRESPVDGTNCWNDAQCKAGEVCEGGTGCGCGLEGCTAAPGHCSLPGVCCLVDAECGESGRCVAARCVPDPGPGTCLSFEDCPGATTCAGAYLCPCGDATCVIPTTEGVCTAGEICCHDAGDCPEGAVCVEGKACLPAPGGNQCYVNGHCGPGRVCEGATVCPCGELCLSGSSVPGFCRTVAVPCTVPADCQAGTRCVIPDFAWCPGELDPQVGFCVEDTDNGCWSAEDCLPFERCSGERICYHPGGCGEPNQPGHCIGLSGINVCCDSHKDCEAGFECRNANTTVTCPPTSTAVCLPIPDDGESCWNYYDCAAGQVCYEAYVCACNARCAWSHEGTCGSPIGQACKTHVDCGIGYTCARDEECNLNPCFPTNNCPISGHCKPKAAGKCWSHATCGAGEYCSGLIVCPTNMDCSDPDVSGECAPLEEAGACCGSYNACGPGLRCLSAASFSGCSIDVSSVCAPVTSFNITCFTDEDCAPSRSCKGAILCPCGLAGCEDGPSPGSCELK